MSPVVRKVFFTFSMDVFPAVWRIFFTFSMNIYPAVWKIFFTFSMNVSPVFRNGFFYSSIEHLIQSNVLESFLQLTYEKRKRDFKWMYISYYLNALQDIFRFFWRLHLFLAFCSSVFFLLSNRLQTFITPKNYGAYALTAFLYSDIFYHRANRGIPRLINETRIQMKNLYMI